VSDPIIKFVKYVCVQDAVYWTPGTPDGYGGYSYTSKAIKCRWDDVSKKVLAQNGDEIVSDAQILVTDTDLKVGGYIWLGSLSNLTTSQKTNPKSVAGAREIKRIERSPLFRSKDEFVMVVYV